MLSIKIVNEPLHLLQIFPLIKILYPKLNRHSDSQLLKLFKKLFQNFNYEIAYLEKNNKVIGLLCYRNSYAVAFGNYIYINDFIIAPQERKKGHGTLLLNWIKEKAQRESRAIHLDVNNQNQSALSFYRKNGLEFRAVHGAWAHK